LYIEFIEITDSEKLRGTASLLEKRVREVLKQSELSRNIAT
jgi:hypothetical protein